MQEKEVSLEAYCDSLLGGRDEARKRLIEAKLIRVEESGGPVRRRPSVFERLRSLPVLLAIIALGAGLGAGYLIHDRWQQIAKYEALRNALGLDPIKSFSFALTDPETLMLSGRIDARSIQRVTLKTPELSEDLHDANAPTDGVVLIEKRLRFERRGAWAGERLLVEVHFVPFEDVAKHIPVEQRVRKKEILVSPLLGIQLDPPTEPVRLDLRDGVRLRGTFYDVPAFAFRDGGVAILVRIAGVRGPWYVQTLVPVKAGHCFSAPSRFSGADEFEVVALVAADVADLPFSPGQSEWEGALPTMDRKNRALERVGPIRFTIVRENP